ncbi:MAG TPA: PAS domain S-box protein [Granulicella sp.]
MSPRDAGRHFGEFAAIVASSNDAIISKTLDGIITSWNPSATLILGYTAEEMIGTSILRIIPPHLHSDELEILEKIQSGERTEHFETIRVTRAGEMLDVSITVSPILDEVGRVTGASKILRDISSRKRIEQSLLQAEKIAATGRMAATIAHEINNPLEAVVNLLYLLRPHVCDTEGISYLSNAESEIARVSHIAKQTLGYYREQSSATTLSLAQLAEQAIDLYQPRCTGFGVRIESRLISSRRLVLRRGEMMQVISNLIVNSIYAMPSGGTLRISVVDTLAPREGVLITVEDTGTGIPEVHRPHIFEAFFTTKENIGTGIGLFIARQFVEGHGGEITVESSTDPATHGTIVSVFLPLHTSYETENLAADALRGRPAEEQERQTASC